MTRCNLAKIFKTDVMSSEYAAKGRLRLLFLLKCLKDIAYSLSVGILRLFSSGVSLGRFEGNVHYAVFSIIFLRTGTYS